MTEELFARISAGLLDCGIKSITILCLAWFITRLLRASAAARHLVWQTTFIVLLLMPIVGSLVPSFGVAHALIDISHLKKKPLIIDTPAVQDNWSATSHLHNEIASVVFKSPPREESFASSKPQRDLKPYFMKGILILWLSGVVLIIIRSLIAYLTIIDYRRRSLLGMQRDLKLALISGRVGLERQWELRTSIHAQPVSAMTWGIFRPIILLPQSSLQWPDGLLESVLLHELAHVRRYDSASQLLIEAVCALYWCNPLVWICARAMRTEAERAADDLVLYAGVKASDYATGLLRLAAAQAGYRQRLVGYGLSIVNGSPIEDRIRSIVEANNNRRGANSKESTTAMIAGLVILLLFASYQAIGLASDTRGSIFYAHQIMTSQVNLSENPDSYSSYDFQTIPARLSLFAHDKRTNEIQGSKVIASDLRMIDSQDDLSQRHELPARDSVTLPADISESESVRQPTKPKLSPGRSPDRINGGANPDQKEGASRPDVLADPAAKNAKGTSDRIINHANSESIQQTIYDKRGADLISLDSPLSSNEEQRRHNPSQLDVASHDMLPNNSQRHSVKKDSIGAPTRSPDVRPASP